MLDLQFTGICCLIIGENKFAACLRSEINVMNAHKIIFRSENYEEIKSYCGERKIPVIKSNELAEIIVKEYKTSKEIKVDSYTDVAKIFRKFRKELFNEPIRIINYLLKYHKKSNWYIIFENKKNEYEYIQYYNSKYGIILAWPYNINNSPKNYSQYIKVNSGLKNYGCKLVKRKRAEELRYHEYWKFTTSNNRKLFKVIKLNAGKNPEEIVELTKYLFLKIYNFKNTNELLIPGCFD